jgi:hypothetical protein
MTTGNFHFYLQNRQIQTSQTGSQVYSDTLPLVFPASSVKTIVTPGTNTLAYCTNRLYYGILKIHTLQKVDTFY